MAILNRIIDFANRPIVSVLAGLFLVIASISELGDALFTFSEGLRAHHGTLVYGIVVMFRNLADMREGLDDVGEVVDRSRPGR